MSHGLKEKDLQRKVRSGQQPPRTMVHSLIFWEMGVVTLKLGDEVHCWFSNMETHHHCYCCGCWKVVRCWGTSFREHCEIGRAKGWLSRTQP